MSSSENDPRRAIRKLNLIGLGVVVLLIGGFGGWAATSELSGAVIASGTIVVESNVKKVQHPTGGVVSEILVNEGAGVEAGQVVMRLDDTVTRAQLGVVQSQLDELIAREARLMAERDGARAVVFPADLNSRRTDPSVATAIAGEEKLFTSRRDAQAGKRSQLRERIAQSNQEIHGLSAQQGAMMRQIKFIDDELVGVNELYTKRLVPISKLKELQRGKAQLEGEQGQYIADIARARGKISETELQIIQVDQDFSTDVLKDLRDSEGKIAELQERVTAAQDQLQRMVIRAPESGIVHQLAVHTVGGVIANGETVMEIVPRDDALVVEAKVSPRDIDQIAVGDTGIVRIMSGNQRTMPDLNGVLTLVSADLNHDPASSSQPSPPYYTVRVSLAADELSRLGDMRLVPGMPVEAFIQTYARTPLQYLLKPLREQIARTFKER